MSFTSQIWGDADGYRCVVSGKMKHTFTPDNKAAIPINTDVWFAPSLFANTERKRVGVTKTKAFWLDIDCGKPGTYESQIDAITAVVTFCQTLNLPEPATVLSGNGVHVWWVLSDYVAPETWSRIAGALREACVDQELLADHGITIDIARIMRVPGTKNYKDKENPKPVQLLNPTFATCELSAIEDSLADYIFKAELKSNAEHSNRLFSVDLPQTPKDADRIADQCQQLRAFRDSNGNLPEPQWYAGLGLLALCTDGGSVAQTWSSGHPSYNPEATTTKLERARDFAPTTCDRFRDVNPDGCSGCPFAGKITSPIQLGESVTPVSIETVADVPKSALVKHTPDIILPKGFLCGKEGVYLNIVSDDGEQLDKKWIFVGQPVWVSGVSANRQTGSEIELSWIDGNGALQSGNIPYSTLEVDAELGKWLRHHLIYGSQGAKLVKMYLDRSISNYIANRGHTNVYNHFGLHDAGFVIGTDLITPSLQIEEAKISQRLDSDRVKKYSVKGSLDTWVKASRKLDKPDWWMHRFTVLSALASPILAFTEEQGSILSLAGESAGGKTTAANFGVSAFGHPEAFTVDPTSTNNAFYERWRQLGNLPMIVNEANKIKSGRNQDRLGMLVYAAANGTARDTQTRDGRSNEKGGWRLLTIFTSNLHLLHLPDNVLQEAQRKRILELTFMPQNTMDISVGKLLNETAKRHCGHAGRKMIGAMMEHRDDLVDAIAEKVTEIESSVGHTYRFGIWQIAATAVIGPVAQALGLIEFEIDDAITNAIGSLKEQAGAYIDPVTRVQDLLDDYTNKFQESIGRRFDNGAWDKEPRGEVRGKVKLTPGKPSELYVASSLFKAHALENGIDINYIRQWVKDRGVQSRAERLADSANPVWCFVTEIAND